MTAFSSFGGLSYLPLGNSLAKSTTSLLESQVITNLAKAHKCTPAQILLRWATQQTIHIIPKSSHSARLQENFTLDHITLSQADMDAISALDAGIRFNDPADFADIPIYC